MEFQKILERLIIQELHMKKEGEDQCRDLDETIRNRQLARKEAAAAFEKKSSITAEAENGALFLYHKKLLCNILMV